MNSPFKYRAFISYSHSDEKWARWLHRRLETYRLPRNLVGRETAFGPVPARFTPVFRDRDELATATSLGATLVAALEQSACQIVICSPKAAQSRWVNEEILTFKRLGREDRIFCLVVAGGQALEVQEITAGWVDVRPLAAGDCRLRAAISGTALEDVIQFAVAPLQPEDMWWQNTCVEDGTTCGLSCRFDVVEENGCEWSWTDEYTCDEDPEDIRCHYVQRYVGLECPETAEFPPYRAECWEE